MHRILEEGGFKQATLKVGLLESVFCRLGVLFRLEESVCRQVQDLRGVDMQKSQFSGVFAREVIGMPVPFFEFRS